jgi:hypothetical protein
MPSQRRGWGLTRRRGVAGTAGAALLLGAVLAGCGSSESGGAVTLNFYDNSDSAEAQQAVVDRCSQQSGGKYKINYVKLPKAADDQRQQLVRRLAARDWTSPGRPSSPRPAGSRPGRTTCAGRWSRAPWPVR